ncbi:MAG: hypothetical protein COB66_02120 [Coxiella sp. (in: Bacteria)]|nr:MAG: hypothetical protein COB66_02120 [Coxiella sp. (in: g-proteobacteria)]
MYKHRYENVSLIILFISLLSILLIYPFFKATEGTQVLLKFMISFVLVAAVAATTHKVSCLIIAGVLGAGALLSNWGSLIDGEYVWITVNLVFNIVFIGYVVWVHLVKIMTTRIVTKNLLFGAICVYMLIGLMMAFVYMLIAYYVPHSFDIATSQILKSNALLTYHFFQYTYFSFVTLTTLGYGDIHPVSQPAEAMAYMEAIMGQFYLTVLVARLIGLHVSNRNKV